MAHVPRAMTNELVAIITGHNLVTNALAVQTLQETASKTLRHHRFGRTNQFEVHQVLQSLIERLYVINNEPLAEALEIRLEELEALASDPNVESLSRSREAQSPVLKWKPEILSLLLHLADHPGEKSGLEDLYRIIPRSSGEKPLSWRDIVGDEGLEEDRAWAAEASKAGKSADGDEDEDEVLTIDSHSSDADGTVASSVDDEDSSRDLSLLTLNVDTKVLDRMRQGQGWRLDDKTHTAVPISELRAIREVLHALLGLPTLLFEYNKSRKICLPTGRFYLETISSPVFHEILMTFGIATSRTFSLRRYCEIWKVTPVLQTFSQCIEHELEVLDNVIFEIEATLARPQGPVIVSLLDVQSKIIPHIDRMCHLEKIVTQTQEDDNEHAYRILDHLFDLACSLQAVGDDGAFLSVAGIFKSCLKTYLAPIMEWMDAGTGASDVEFVQQNGAEPEPATFWTMAFSLKKEAGVVMVPGFLRPYVACIFSAGKQIAFLKALKLPHLVRSNTTSTPPTFLLDMSESDGVSSALTPFSNLVDRYLQECLSRPGHGTSSVLCDYLEHRAGLFQALEALSNIYLCASGAAFQTFADTILARFADSSTALDNPVIIEGLARTAFSTIPGVQGNSITALRLPDSVAITRGGRHGRAKSGTSIASNAPGGLQVKAHNIVSLASIQLHYSLSPVLQNIIPYTSLQTYRAVQTLLLQLQLPLMALSRLSLSTLPRHTLALRQALLHTLTMLVSHILHAGVAPLLTSLNTEMHAAQTLDGMLATHTTFVIRLGRRCLVADELISVRDVVLGLCEMGSAFAMRCTSPQNMRGIFSMAGSGQAQEDTDDETCLGVDERLSAGQKMAGDACPAAAKVREMQGHLRQLVSLLVVGLRAAGREQAGSPTSTGRRGGCGEVEQTWTMLADELESSLKSSAAHPTPDGSPDLG